MIQQTIWIIVLAVAPHFPRYAEEYPEELFQRCHLLRSGDESGKTFDQDAWVILCPSRSNENWNCVHGKLST